MRGGLGGLGTGLKVKGTGGTRSGFFEYQKSGYAVEVCC